MMKSTHGTIRAAALVLFLFMCVPSFSANIIIPTMELITHGVASGGLFVLQTYGNMALEVQGGYKFGGSISFGLFNQSILENQNLPIQFLSASMTIRDVFSLPMNVVYFVGQNDIFGSGSGFEDFGEAIEAGQALLGLGKLLGVHFYGGLELPSLATRS